MFVWCYKETFINRKTDSASHPLQDDGFLTKLSFRLETSAVTKSEILEELPTLTAEDRQEIRQKLNEIDGDDWLDGDDPLTEDEKALLEHRLTAYEKEPDSEGRNQNVMEALRRVKISGSPDLSINASLYDKDEKNAR